MAKPTHSPFDPALAADADVAEMVRDLVRRAGTMPISADMRAKLARIAEIIDRGL
jgi:hypothetical protein